MHTFITTGRAELDPLDLHWIRFGIARLKTQGAVQRSFVDEPAALAAALATLHQNNYTIRSYFQTLWSLGTNNTERSWAFERYVHYMFYHLFTGNSPGRLRDIFSFTTNPPEWVNGDTYLVVKQETSWKFLTMVDKLNTIMSRKALDYNTTLNWLRGVLNLPLLQPDNNHGADLLCFLLVLDEKHKKVILVEVRSQIKFRKDKMEASEFKEAVLSIAPGKEYRTNASSQRSKHCLWQLADQPIERFSWGESMGNQSTPEPHRRYQSSKEVNREQNSLEQRFSTPSVEF
jgi:hypothetical protein